MPPTRNKPAHPVKPHKGNNTGGSQTKNKQPQHRKQPGQDGLELPGVQKLKATLRQTRRLLAKDNLAADVRVETERRLKSLEGDLAMAETKKKERAMATKYHMVKFFERKKVMRKITQVKKELESTSPSSSKAVAKLEKQLTDLRVDLNYILHYPKLEKYVSLFPVSDQGEKGAVVSEDTPDETESKRRSLRDDIRHKMDEGKLSREPDLEENHSQSPQDHSGSRDVRQDKHPKSKRRKKGNAEEPATEKADFTGNSVRNDDFFETDD